VLGSLGVVDSVAGLIVPGPPFSVPVTGPGPLASSAEFALCSEPPHAARKKMEAITKVLGIWVIFSLFRS
jgi:hypothetical protein